MEDGLYRLDNAPAFAFGVSLHDVIEVFRDQHGGFWATRVVRRGPFYTVRVALDALRPRSLRLLKLIAALGCSSEGMNSSWFVISAPDETSFGHLVERLGTDDYCWEYVNPKREEVPSPHPRASLERLIPEDIIPAEQALLHPEAPWRDRADDELEVLATVSAERQRVELLPARRVGERLWELCCAPFFATGLALGDIVEADERLRIMRAISRSGRGSIFAFTSDPDRVSIAMTSLARIGCGVERRTRTATLAVDCATAQIFDDACEWLGEQEDLTFEILQPPSRPVTGDR
jgi:hypothetical protein